jgi:uncharacterized protein
MITPRLFQTPILDRLTNSSKIVVLYGPRQVGKTTLIRHLLTQLLYRTLAINADALCYIDVLSSRDLNQMKLLVDGYDLLFIDEAQRIPDVGLNLKILHDGLPNLRIVVTGSSSFELANRTKEPLTGRTWTYTLFPIATVELRQRYNPTNVPPGTATRHIRNRTRGAMPRTRPTVGPGNGATAAIRAV